MPIHDGHGRLKDHPSGWTVLEASPASESSSSHASDSSDDDMSDELRSSDKMDGHNDTPIKTRALPHNPETIRKRKALSLSISPIAGAHKRGRVGRRNHENPVVRSVASSPSKPQRQVTPDPFAAITAESSTARISKPSRVAKYARRPFPSLKGLTNTASARMSPYTKATPTHIDELVSPSRAPVARKSTGGRGQPKTKGLEKSARLRIAEAVRELRTSKFMKSSGPTKDKTYIEISDSEDEASEQPIQSLNKPNAQPNASVSKPAPATPAAVEKAQKIANSLPIALAQAPNEHVEYIVISSDSDSGDDRNSEPHAQASSPQPSPVSHNQRESAVPSRHSNQSVSRENAIWTQSGKRDEPIIISDSEDERESGCAHRPSSPEASLAVANNPPNDDTDNRDRGSTEAMRTSPDPNDMTTSDFEGGSAIASEQSTPAQNVLTLTQKFPAIAVSSVSRSESFSPSNKLKRRVTMVGTLYGGQDGFFKRAHSGSQSALLSRSTSARTLSRRATISTISGQASRRSVDQTTSDDAMDVDDRPFTVEKTDVAVAELHEAVSQMSSQIKAFQDSISPPVVETRASSSDRSSLSDIINNAALQNARFIVPASSKKSTPIRTQNRIRSPTIEEEELEVESILDWDHDEDADEDPSRLSPQAVEKARKQFETTLSESGVSSRRTSMPSSAHTSPTPQRSLRPKRNTKFAFSKKPKLTRYGVEIVGSKINILMHKGRYPAKEYASLDVDAKILPHDVADYIRALSQMKRITAQDKQEIFADVIQANTRDDELDAPRIPIVNDINPEDEPTPSYEYHYSNLMIHHEHVPQPQLKSSVLSHCRCIGGCKPHSCPCAARQMQHLPSNRNWSGFAYVMKDSVKTLRPGMFGYPIIECNMYCGCDDECQNRVVQHGRTSAVKVRIQKTPKKGWGIFADCEEFIPENTFIAVYAGEYITVEEAELREKIYNKSGRTYLFDVDFDFDSPDDISMASEDKDEENKASYCIDAFYTGNFTRYLNHSCDPNCVIMACYINESNIKKPLLTIFSCRDILPNEELCLSYIGDVNAVKSDSITSHGATFGACKCGSAGCVGRIWK